jgi:hypothetical protein
MTLSGESTCARRTCAARRARSAASRASAAPIKPGGDHARAPNRDVPGTSYSAAGGTSSSASVTIDGQSLSVGASRVGTAGWCGVVAGWSRGERISVTADGSPDADAAADADADAGARPMWHARVALRWPCTTYAEQARLESLAALTLFCRDGLLLDFTEASLDAVECVDLTGAHEPPLLEPASGVVEFKIGGDGDSTFHASVPARADRRVSMDVTITTTSAHYSSTPAHVECY